MDFDDFFYYHAGIYTFRVIQMNTVTIKTTAKFSPWILWTVAVGFVLFQFFLQLSSGVLVNALISEYKLSALGAGILTSSYYYIYFVLQIPVGVLLDKYGSRLLLTLGALGCALWCICFANAHTLWTAIISRLLMGGGAAFAFVGLLHVIRDNFALRRYAFMVGLAEAVGLIGSIIGTIGLAIVLKSYGWRLLLTEFGCLGIVIAFCCWYFLPNKQPHEETVKFSLQDLRKVLFDKTAWLNGVFIGLLFSIITVFAALWAPSFLQIKLATNLTMASSLSALIFLGAAIACPLFGQLDAVLERKRHALMQFSAISTTILFLILLYAPITNPLFCGLLVLAIGVCCSSYMLSFAITDEIAPTGLKSTYTGFTNTLAVISAPILQPLVGFLIDNFSKNDGHDLIAYQKGLLIMPLFLLCGALIVFFLPKQRC